jgi:hypothetical protein
MSTKSNHQRLIKVVIDGSHCPHYKCGGYSYSVTDDSGFFENSSGVILQSSSPFYAESVALHKAIECIHGVWPVLKPFSTVHVLTDNQNIAARMNKANEFIRHLNYRRDDPWDKIHKLMVEMNWLSFTPAWESFTKKSAGFHHHKMAKQMMLGARQQIISTHA